MITTIYTIILAYFLMGAVGFYFINRRKEKEVARKSWIKFISYFFIINILFFSIVVNSRVFGILAVAIVLVGMWELFNLFKKSRYVHGGFFAISVLIYSLLAIGFITFSGFSQELILFAFLILSIFDAFSQISGQLFGKTKIAPKISPNKTFEGTVGGAIVAVLSALLLRELNDVPWYQLLVLSAGIVVFAYFGDIAASLYKRKFGVKDYNNLIPGHGGFLDRFDSLIAGGAWVVLYISIYIH